MDQKLTEKLKKTGLADKESRIYTYLLSVGGAYPSRIARETGINRSTTYKILTALSVRGLVSEVERRKKLYYQITGPQRLISAVRYGLRRKEEELERAQSLLPKLETIYARSAHQAKVSYYKDVKEILRLYRTHIEVKKPYEMRALAGIQDVVRFLPGDYYAEYIKAKEKIGITTRAIFPDVEEAYTIMDKPYKITEGKIKPQLRFADTNKIPLSGEVTLYDQDKVSVVNLKQEVLVGVVIEDEAIHNLIGLLFELAWQTAEPLREE